MKCKTPDCQNDRLKTRRLCGPCRSAQSCAWAAGARPRRNSTYKKWYDGGGKCRVIEAQRERNTGWTPAAFAAAWATQNGACAICQQELRARHAADHEHVVPPRPRAILCMPCNTSLGNYEKHQRKTIVIAPYEEYLARYS